MMVDWYDGTNLLDVDVYQVGHHGSHNGTTFEMLTAMTPEIAVVSCGNLYRGADNHSSNALRYGHPNRGILMMLSSVSNGNRSTPITRYVGTGAYRSKKFTVNKRIYATAWDGTVKVRATMHDEYRVTKTN